MMETVIKLERMISETFYISEIESPFKMFILPNKENLLNFLVEQTNEKVGKKIKELPISYLYKNITTLAENSNSYYENQQYNCQRYLNLLNYFTENFKDIAVYGIGEKNINIFITGCSSNNEVIILYTLARE